MILLYENSVNLVFFTLTEKKRNSTKKYLFQFTNNTSGESFYCIADDKSHTPYRYNSFCITHVTGERNPIIGEVNFTLPGFYTYNVYENPDSIFVGEDDDINSFINAGLIFPVETGKMKFVTESQPTEVFENPVSPNHVVFNPDDY